MHLYTDGGGPIAAISIQAHIPLGNSRRKRSNANTSPSGRVSNAWQGRPSVLHALSWCMTLSLAYVSIAMSVAMLC